MKELNAAPDGDVLQSKLPKEKQGLSLFLILLFLVLCLLHVSFLLLSFRLAQVIYLAVLFLSGFYHNRLVLAKTHTVDIENVIVTLIGFFIILLAGFLLQALIKELPFLLLLAGGCAFMLPYILHQLWSMFTYFFPGPLKIWAYSNEVELQKSTTFLNSMPVRFRIKLPDAHGGEQRVAFRAPVKLKLGLIFYHIVKSTEEREEERILLISKNEEAFQWVFSTNRFGWEQYLNPELGLIENGIRQNDLISVKQLPGNLNIVLKKR